MATVNPAKVMKIDHLTGKLNPGQIADELVAINLKDFSCTFVMSSVP